MAAPAGRRHRPRRKERALVDARPQPRRTTRRAQAAHAALRGEDRARHLLLRLRSDGAEAQGGTRRAPERSAGWFFVIKERPGEPRFGLDETADGPDRSSGATSAGTRRRIARRVHPAGRAARRPRSRRSPAGRREKEPSARGRRRCLGRRHERRRARLHPLSGPGDGRRPRRRDAAQRAETWPTSRTPRAARPRGRAQATALAPAATRAARTRDARGAGAACGRSTRASTTPSGELAAAREAALEEAAPRARELERGRGRVADRFAELADPRKAIAQLSDDIPILLFPVRLETRFKTRRRAAAHDELWVRIYPDDCSSTHSSPSSQRPRSRTRGATGARCGAQAAIEAQRARRVARARREPRLGPSGMDPQQYRPPTRTMAGQGRPARTSSS